MRASVRALSALATTAVLALLLACSDQSTVIRRAPAATVHREPHDQPENIAPLATISVSSSEQAPPIAAGVADGQVNDNEWAPSRRGDSWIKLTWERTVNIMEIALYDRASLEDNILKGTLVFDDGTEINVPALPPDGKPWRVSFGPRTANWVMFRVADVQGVNAGLAEIMVFGNIL